LRKLKAQNGDQSANISFQTILTDRQQRKLEVLGGSPLAFSPDGKVLASEDLASMVHLWDVASGTQLRTLEHPYRILSVAFAPDGTTLAVGTAGSFLRLWDAFTGKELLKLKGDLGEIATLSFSPDGKMLAVGSGDNKIHLLEVSSGKERHTLTGHPG